MSNPVPQCTHVKTNGEVCGSPAVSGTELCYHHSAIKTTLGKVASGQAANGAFTPIPFLFPEDRASMQINFFLLLQAFNEQRIDQKTYRLMLSMLKAMAKNLGKTGSLVDEARDQESETGDQKVSDQNGSNQKGSEQKKADELESLLDLKASAAIAPENCFSKNPQVQINHNDLFRISTLDLTGSGNGFHQTARPLTR